MADTVAVAVPAPADTILQKPRKRKVRKGTKGKRRTSTKSKKQTQAPQAAAKSGGINTGLLLAIGLPVVGLVGAAVLLTKLLRRGSKSSGGKAAGGDDKRRKEAIAKALAAVPFAYTHRQLIDLIMVVRAAGTPEDAEDLVKQLRQDQLMHIIQGAQKAPEEFQELVQALGSVGIRIMVRPAGAAGAEGAAGDAAGGAAAGSAAGGGGAAGGAGGGGAAGGAGGAAVGKSGFPEGTMTMEDYLNLIQQQRARAAMAQAAAAGGPGVAAAAGGPAAGAARVEELDGDEEGYFDEDGEMFEEGDFDPEEGDFDLDDNGDFDHYDH